MPDFATYISQLKGMFIVLFPIVSSEEWTGSEWTPENRQSLNVLMHSIDKMFNDKLRPTYDRTIWNGHKSGKVPTSLEPVRAATVKKDAADKVAPTAEELFDAMVGTLPTTK